VAEHIVGMMWNKNEGDIIDDTIFSALDHVDTLFIADDGSTDDSWHIIKDLAETIPEIEHIQRRPSKGDPAQRQSLLNQIRMRYRPENTWVQIIESDIMILDTDIRKAIAERARKDVCVNWALLNAVIDPTLDWADLDTYPDWRMPIQDIMTHGHWLEEMTYTFRPHKELWYDLGPWRPWPKGFSKFGVKKEPVRTDYTPLLAHYGYRGPTHLHKKFSPDGRYHKRYKSWDFDTPETTKNTVFFFNGVWNSHAFPMSREGYAGRKG
jgi:glycosyltransferase involved in cell wall biosynthesis